MVIVDVGVEVNVLVALAVREVVPEEELVMVPVDERVEVAEALIVEVAEVVAVVVIHSVRSSDAFL